MIKAVIFDMYETLITQFESPLYYGTHMAADIGVEADLFMPVWRRTEADRATGGMTTEEAIAWTLQELGVYSDELFRRITHKRNAIQADCFLHIHKEIFPMLDELKANDIRVGLISNCFSEEAALIRASGLFPYFDSVCLSYEEGITKPNPEIFCRCMNRLALEPEECLYVGDGGSDELEMARKLGMEALQAVWYRSASGTGRMAEIRPDFKQIDSPLAISGYAIGKK